MPPLLTHVPGRGFWRNLWLAAAGGILASVLRAEASPASLPAQINSVLRKSYPADGPGAAAIIVQRGHILLRAGYGLADVERGTLIAPQNVFRVASLTKQFTAVAILQLAEEGRLRLDDEITRYVPDCPTHGERITLAQLLNHTSGLPNYTADARFRAVPRQDLSLGQILSFIRDQPLNFVPGKGWSYCNTGYLLLGAVIEKVSGQRYGAYLQDHVFKAAGLTHTFCGRGEEPSAGEIAGYSRTLDRRWTRAEYLNSTQAYAAGALASDVDDLWIWEKALGDGRLIRPDLLALARSPARCGGGRELAGYGFGWELGYIDGQAAAGHGGTISGFRAYEVSVPSLGLYLAILCNADRPDPAEVAEQIVRVVAGEVSRRLSAPQVRSYVGVYQSGPTDQVKIALENGQLVLEPSGLTPRPLRAISGGQFIDPESADWFGFTQDSHGRVVSLEIRPRSGVAAMLPRSESSLFAGN